MLARLQLDSLYLGTHAIYIEYKPINITEKFYVFSHELWEGSLYRRVVIASSHEMLDV